MANVLPYIPSFGEKLVPTVAGALGNIAKGYGQRRTNLYDQQILEGLAQNQNASPMDQIKAFGSLSSERQKTLAPLFTQWIKSQQKQQKSPLEKPKEKKADQPKSKPKFMKSNKEHMAKFDNLVKKHGKDQEKIRKILQKDFDLE